MIPTHKFYTFCMCVCVFVSVLSSLFYIDIVEFVLNAMHKYLLRIVSALQINGGEFLLICCSPSSCPAFPLGRTLISVCFPPAIIPQSVTCFSSIIINMLHLTYRTLDFDRTKTNGRFSIVFLENSMFLKLRCWKFIKCSRKIDYHIDLFEDCSMLLLYRLECICLRQWQ